MFALCPALKRWAANAVTAGLGSALRKHSHDTRTFNPAN
jgi:hypothetical protein